MFVISLSIMIILCDSSWDVINDNVIDSIERQSFIWHDKYALGAHWHLFIQ